MWASSFHEESIWIINLFEKLFSYPKFQYIVGVQINKDIYNQVKAKNGLEKRVSEHWIRLQKIVPRQNVFPVQGTKYQSARMDTLNFYYNPTLFELLLSLARGVLYSLPLIAKKRLSKEWFIGSPESLTTPIAHIDTQKFISSIRNEEGKQVYQCHRNLLADELVIKKRRGKKTITLNRAVPLNISVILWAALMEAEGRKSGAGFTSQDPEVIKLFMHGPDEIFTESPYRSYELLIGEFEHMKLHSELNEPLEKEIKTKAFPYCKSQKVLLKLTEQAQSMVPRLKSIRFFGARADTYGKKRKGITIDLFFMGTTIELVRNLTKWIFYDIDKLIEGYAINQTG